MIQQKLPGLTIKDSFDLIQMNLTIKFQLLNAEFVIKIKDNYNLMHIKNC